MRAHELEEGKYYKLTSVRSGVVPVGSIFVGTQGDAIDIYEAKDGSFDDENKLVAVCVWSPNRNFIGHTAFGFIQDLEFEPVNLVLEGLDP